MQVLPRRWLYARRTRAVYCSNCGYVSRVESARCPYCDEERPDRSAISVPMAAAMVFVVAWCSDALVGTQIVHACVQGVVGEFRHMSVRWPRW